MVFLVPIVFLAASTTVQLVDEVYRIPAREWRWVPVSLRQQPALITAVYRAQDGPTQIRLRLIRRADLDKFREGLPPGVIAATAFGANGSLAHPIAVPGDYVILVENEGDTPARVRLRIALDFSRAGPRVTRLTPQRQFTVIAISFAVFFGIVTWSARRLLRAVRKG